MFAEIFSSNSERKFNIHIIKHVNDTIITTIPKLKNEIIGFLPEETIYITIPSGTFIYSFEVSFEKIQKINKEFFYNFNVIYESKKENVRRDKRVQTDLPAVLKFPQTEIPSFAQIIDLSQNGFRIETNKSIPRRIFNISYENGVKSEIKRVKIAWSKKVNNMYQYGLQAVL